MARVLLPLWAFWVLLIGANPLWAVRPHMDLAEEVGNDGKLLPNKDQKKEEEAVTITEIPECHSVAAEAYAGKCDWIKSAFACYSLQKEAPWECSKGIQQPKKEYCVGKGFTGVCGHPNQPLVTAQDSKPLLVAAQETKQDTTTVKNAASGGAPGLMFVALAAWCILCIPQQPELA
mmetsp:Transcript_107928/g.208978  ORF Transcript_107928/g.208978 Transcript_107928/m.208978 type:complete len:176 (-) Transcript_107928:120-647(-)